ncbi:MAG TPA: HAD-IC family P-type ATPase [Acidimicrobiia bacterium]|nr:HAD-IC family P-type ATPase [Acidimicrobiia bacterium]
MTSTEAVWAETGLNDAEVRQRVTAGLTNEVPARPSRTTAEIVRANVVTRFNILLGALLLVTLIVLQQPRDALFGIVLITNSAIGIVQELRAKRTLDRLELVAAPKVSVVRSGRMTEQPVDKVVVDDLIDLRPGDQLVVDGVVVSSSGLEIDESLLTGEADPVHKQIDDECLSGSFVAAGSGRYRATKVGGEAYAARLAQAAKRFTLVRSELREGIDRILGIVSWIVVPMGALLVWSIVQGGSDVIEGLGGAVAAGVAMVPQGLVLLASIAFALGVIRLGRRNVLVQELPAIEGLARVDTVCFDKTGTLTAGRLAVEEVLTLTDHDPIPALAAIAAAEEHPNNTMQAIAAAFPDPPDWGIQATIPFSSARKWSGVTFYGDDTWVIGAPDVVAPTDEKTRQVVSEVSGEGSRALLVARSDQGFEGGRLPSNLEPAAVVVLSDHIREDAEDTLRYFAEQGVRVKVISGDHPDTVAAIAAKVGVPDADSAIDARFLPPEGEELADMMESVTVFGRVSPQQKQAMVRALQSRGHTVAMTGDGVNDVLALKESDIGIAIGSGAPASRAVAQLVLIDGQFATLPEIVGEGRRVTSNVERVANLFITSTVYAVGLSLAIVISSLPFPFLARHLTLVGSLTVGIPSFFLALAPSRRRARPGFLGRVLKFAIPTGILATLATFAGYWLADMEGSTVAESRTTATLILAAVGLMALGIVSRPLVPWKKGLIAAMSGLLVLAMVVPAFRTFFALDLPRPVVLLSAVGIVAFTGLVMVFALRAVGWARLVPELLRDVPASEASPWEVVKQRVVDRSGWDQSFPSTTEMQPVSRHPPVNHDPDDDSEEVEPRGQTM